MQRIDTYELDKVPNETHNHKTHPDRPANLNILYTSPQHQNEQMQVFDQYHSSLPLIKGRSYEVRWTYLCGWALCSG